MAIKVAVVVADLHCGSTRGLCCPNFTTEEGQTVGLNAAQTFLWEHWEAAWDLVYTLVGDDQWALVGNGDMIEGNHHRTTEIVSPVMSDHVAIALECLLPHSTKAAARLFTLGTECHTSNAEHHIAATCEAIKDPNTGRAAWERLSVSFNDCLCRFTHHTSTVAREWTSQINSHISTMQLAALRSGQPVPKVLGQAHCHVYAESRKEGAFGFTSPSWQILTRYGNKAVPNAIPMIGLIVLDWRRVPPGDLPEVHRYTRSYWGDKSVTL